MKKILNSHSRACFQNIGLAERERDRKTERERERDRERQKETETERGAREGRTG